MKSIRHAKNQALASLDGGAMKHGKQLSRDAIAAKAHQFYMEQGCPGGRSLAHWLEAEASLRAKQNATAQTTEFHQSPK